MKAGLARKLGRLLCTIGLHSWVPRSEFHRTLIVTFNSCGREGCPRYAEEFVVDMERRAASGCTCQRHAVSLTCPLHGHYPHESASIVRSAS